MKTAHTENSAIKISKKLTLNKHTIAPLNSTGMGNIIGGMKGSSDPLCYPSVQICPTGYTIDFCDI